MNFAAALSTKPDHAAAVADLLHQVRAAPGPARCDLALLFLHPHYREHATDLAKQLQVELGAKRLLGCTAAGIIGGTQELENRPAISLLAGQLPGVTVTPFHLTQTELAESSGAGYWHFQLEVESKQDPNLLLLADPFSVRITDLVRELGDAYPAAPLLGGLASGSQQPGQTRLVLDDEVFEDGAVGVALTGAVRLHAIVSQGCKPIGEPLVITRAEKNVVFELGGRPPLQVLQELHPQLSPRDQQLAQTALLLGRVINEYQENFQRGDFLIRNLINHDPKTGALAVGDWMRTGQTVQFQVRDGQTAAEDMHALLAQHRRQLGATQPAAALLFSCLGRGAGMYGVPHHDIRALQEEFGALPTAGFFCNGEIGPVGDRSYVHGFTSVIGLFCPVTSEATSPRER